METITFTDSTGATMTFYPQSYTDAAVAAAIASVPTAAGVPEAEVAKLESEVAAVDTELKADETTAA